MTMKVKKAPMPLWQKIIYILSFVFLFWAFIYLGTKEYNTPIKELSDSESFTKEFGITSNNVYDYITAKEALEILNTKTGIIFFGFPENNWSHTYASLLNEVAKYYEIDKIYYYNFKKDRANNNSYYENIVAKLRGYLPVLDDGEVDLYAPSVVFVKEGQIIGYDDETSIIHGTVDPITYWTGEKMQTQKVLFGTLVSKYLGEDDGKEG